MSLWPETCRALPLLTNRDLKKDTWDCSSRGNETGIWGLWRAIWEVSFLIAMAGAGFSPNLVFCLGEYKIMRLLLLPRGDPRIALEISLSAWVFSCLKPTWKNEQRRKQGEHEPVLMLSGGQKLLLSFWFLLGFFCWRELFVDSFYVRNSKVREFTIENISLWKMRGTGYWSQCALKVSAIDGEGMLWGWKNTECFTAVHWKDQKLSQ